MYISCTHNLRLDVKFLSRQDTWSEHRENACRQQTFNVSLQRGRVPSYVANLSFLCRRSTWRVCCIDKFTKTTTREVTHSHIVYRALWCLYTGRVEWTPASLLNTSKYNILITKTTVQLKNIVSKINWKIMTA